METDVSKMHKADGGTALTAMQQESQHQQKKLGGNDKLASWKN